MLMLTYIFVVHTASPFRHSPILTKPLGLAWLFFEVLMPSFLRPSSIFIASQRSTVSTTPKSIRPLSAFTALLFLSISTAHSSDTSTEHATLETVVVSASRTEMSLRELGVSMTVMTQDEIERIGSDTVADVLRHAPAVYVSNNGGVGKTSSVRIRGEEGFRTLVLLDGLDISDPTSPQVSARLEHILASGIERIEVLRGPQGLMYGADAGGVINIYTPEVQQGQEGLIDLELGRYDTRRASASFGGGNESVTVYVHAANLSTDGFNSRADDIVLNDNDGYENTTLHGRMSWQVAKPLKVSLVARDVDSDNDFDNCFGRDARQDQCLSQFKQSQWLLSSVFDAASYGLHRLAVSQSNTHRESFALNTRNLNIEGDLQRAEYTGQFSITPMLNMLLGIDYEDESVDGEVLRSRHQEGYFFEYQLNLQDQFFMTAGARHDDNETFGSHDSYRITGAYWLIDKASYDVKLKASYGNGFRAPSLFEIAYNQNSAVAFAPALGLKLETEKSRGFDVGLEWHTLQGQRYEVVYFKQLVDDEIFFDLNTFSGYLQRTGQTKSSGVEVALDIPLGQQWAWTMNYTFNETEQASGEQRIRRPKHLANMDLNYTSLDNRSTVGLSWRGAYDAIDFGSGEALDDVSVVSVHASHQVNSSVKLYVSWDNVLGSDYEEVVGFNTSGSAVYLGTQIRF